MHLLSAGWDCHDAHCTTARVSWLCRPLSLNPGEMLKFVAERNDGPETRRSQPEWRYRLSSTKVSGGEWRYIIRRRGRTEATPAARMRRLQSAGTPGGATRLLVRARRYCEKCRGWIGTGATRRRVRPAAGSSDAGSRGSAGGRCSRIVRGRPRRSTAPRPVFLISSLGERGPSPTAARATSKDGRRSAGPGHRRRVLNRHAEVRAARFWRGGRGELGLARRAAPGSFPRAWPGSVRIPPMAGGRLERGAPRPHCLSPAEGRQDDETVAGADRHGVAGP